MKATMSHEEQREKAKEALAALRTPSADGLRWLFDADE